MVVSAGEVMALLQDPEEDLRSWFSALALAAAVDPRAVITMFADDIEARYRRKFVIIDAEYSRRSSRGGV